MLFPYSEYCSAAEEICALRVLLVQLVKYGSAYFSITLKLTHFELLLCENSFRDQLVKATEHSAAKCFYQEAVKTKNWAKTGNIGFFLIGAHKQPQMRAPNVLYLLVCEFFLSQRCWKFFFFLIKLINNATVLLAKFQWNITGSFLIFMQSHFVPSPKVFLHHFALYSMAYDGSCLPWTLSVTVVQL